MFTTRPELQGTFGMVASTHWLATAAGMAVLEAGGNAFDAAVATGFALQVVEPHLNGPGGEVPVLYVDAREGRPRVLCGQGPAPAGASIAHFRGLGLDLVPGTGPLAACVPGAFDAWALLLRDHGTFTLRQVLEPAIGYAARGHPVHHRLAETVAGVAELFSTDWTESARVYLPGGRPPAPGTLLRNPALAATYSRLLAEAEAVGPDRDEQVEAARRVWREGSVAEAVVQGNAVSARDSSGEAHAGLLAVDDLAGYRATVEDPVSLDWRGWTVCKTGPWGQGPVFLQQLALLDGFPPVALRPGSAEMVHTVVECAKLAFADREAWYADPRFVDVPLDDLLSPAYADERRRLVAGQASLRLRPGSPGGREPRLPAWPGAPAAAPGAGEPTTGGPVERPAGGDTVHLDVVDRHGNLVTATPSGGWLQGSPVLPGLGFPLGTRAQMFWLQEGLPGSLAGGKRPRTTLSPTLVLRDGEPVLGFGTPGGDQQDQWSLVFFLWHVLGGRDLQAALDAPCWHTTAFPSSFWPRQAHLGEVVAEDRLGEDVLGELARRGHRVRRAGPWALGRTTAVARDPASGLVRAAANARGVQGYAAGR